MDRRTFEGPMDWEYHNKGPFDPTSPFTHAAQGSGLKNGFSSPSKELGSSQPNFGTPSRNQQPRPLFTPQHTAPRPTAPAFRNPAFTTPRKPFDHAVMSEASDIDESPAQTEASDFPNDTPETDRMSDVNMGGTITPAKIDKNFRYNRGGASGRRHMPGKGEIRPHREAGAGEMSRRKKMYGPLKDTRHGRHQSMDSEEESDTESSLASVSRRSARHRNDHGPPRRGGVVGSMFHMMEEHRTAPENLHRWIQLGINVFMGGLFCAIVVSVVQTIYSDVHAVNEAARQELRAKMATCQDAYMANGCANTEAPAFKKLCTEWYDCMMQDPAAIIKVRATMTEIAHIMNDFFGNLNIKAWGAVLLFLVFTTLANNVVIGKQPTPSMTAPSAGPPHPSSAHHGDYMAHPESSDMVWVPRPTPRMRSRVFMDEETDTDGTPPSSQKFLPPLTPSGRRSPSKRERSVSPIKYSRSPRKMH